MGNVLRVLERDAMRLLKAPAALVVVLALLVLPSVYTWYNVLGFWNPYDNTGNLRVCVVNDDEGAMNEITGQLNVGDRIVEQLSENDQLKWVFEDYDAAMADLRSGSVYAVYVIPSDFSKDILSPLTGSIEHPKLQYYVNEKLGSVSPKITDAGATTLDQTINSTFVSTVSDVVVQSVDRALEDARADVIASKARSTGKLSQASDSIQGVRDSLVQVRQTTQDASDRATSARSALDDANSQLDGASQVLSDISAQSGAVQSGLSSVSAGALPALTDSLSAISQMNLHMGAAANGLSSAIGSANADVGLVVSRAQAVCDNTRTLANDLHDLAASMDADDPLAPAVQQQADDLSSRSDELQNQIDAVTALGSSASHASQSLSETLSALDAASQGTIDATQNYSQTLLATTLPAVDSSLQQLGQVSSDMSASISGQKGIVDQAQLSLDQLSGLLRDSASALDQTDALMAALQDDMTSVSSDISTLVESGIIVNLFEGGKLNAGNIAEFMGSPTQLETVTLYHPNAYGSAMAPLFMNLTFWIGAFMLLVILRQEVDDEGVENLTLSQRYMARFLLFSLFAVVQAVVCVAGVLLIGVQAANVAALFFASAVASLAYLSVIYSLSLVLRHIGKGVCIVLVFAQIPGASGLYPVELTSRFFQTIYPLFPFSYGIGAMREAIGGFYGSHYTNDILGLAAFFFVALFLGLLLHPLMGNVNRMVASQIRQSDLFNGEDVITPARPYRFSQLVRVLSDREDFHDVLMHRYARFSRLYPLFIKGTIIVGAVLSVALVLTIALTTTEKVILLTFCLVSMLILFVFLVVVESLRYSFERQLDMENMSDERLLVYSLQRNRLVHASTKVTSDVRENREDAKLLQAKAAKPDESGESVDVPAAEGDPDE